MPSAVQHLLELRVQSTSCSHSLLHSSLIYGSNLVKKPLASAARGTRESIAQAVMKEVLDGSIPPGTRLITESLANRFLVSHTPVREALLTLAGMGIVEIVPNRGAVVKRFSPREIREVCDVRLALELLAIRSA